MASISDQINMSAIFEGLERLKAQHQQLSTHQRDLLVGQAENKNLYTDSTGEKSAEGYGLWKIEGSAAMIASAEQGAEFRSLVKEGAKTIIIVIAGQLKAMIDNNTYSLDNGEHITVEPGQHYSLYYPKSSCALCVTFPAEETYPKGLSALNELLSHGPKR